MKRNGTSYSRDGLEYNIVWSYRHQTNTPCLVCNKLLDKWSKDDDADTIRYHCASCEDSWKPTQLRTALSLLES